MATGKPLSLMLWVANAEIQTGDGQVELFLLSPEFEKEVRRLGLTKQTCVGSSELRLWCERNRNRCYIPGWLLEEWKILVDPYFSAA